MDIDQLFTRDVKYYYIDKLPRSFVNSYSIESQLHRYFGLQA